MTLQNKGSYKDKIQLYVPSENDKEIIYKTRKLLKRDGKTLSKFFIEKVTEYYHLHEPGNPQQRVDHDWSTGKPYRALGVCGFKGCGENGVGSGVFLPKGKKFLLCNAHLIKAKGDKRSWKILS